ncbi:hypothetical protein BVRB_4g094510 [Beta vulgaris subsp. vulgaris]|uniref:Uncharacterized protein n=1 Tax=Beta vulgaris subsp. vulgaris TaxID=3555 RepID=A0A0J8BBG4_BETVV|nr:hypothetical protein BVRB_4g094510 [Beta vulgaris subsp. vulgaris]
MDIHSPKFHHNIGLWLCIFQELLFAFLSFGHFLD